MLHNAIVEENGEQEANSTYALIIQTHNVNVYGGEYLSYEDVINHAEESHGVRIFLEDREIFLPWSSDGGIDAIVRVN